MGFDLLIALSELLKLDFVSVKKLADQSPMKRKAIETSRQVGILHISSQDPVIQLLV